MQRLTRILTLLLVCSITIFMACEGPQGPEGPQGTEGPEGPVGPAGEDGSMMYSGEGEPGTDIGDNGDYYLNTNTGEMYGPKEDDGWGNPIIVLMGEDGEDGEDGQDGEDGEDGSQIHSGSSAPDGSLGSVGDYYLDEDSYDMYGPKTESGWGSPLNLKGADGNANVTRYILPGHDFSNDTYNPVNVPVENKMEMKESAWKVYLVGSHSASAIEEAYWSIPGYGRDRSTLYNLEHYFNESFSEVVFAIFAESSGEEYGRIEIVQIRANRNEDLTKRAGSGAIIPETLDTSDYQEVAEYYGFYQ